MILVMFHLNKIYNTFNKKLDTFLKQLLSTQNVVNERLVQTITKSIVSFIHFPLVFLKIYEF